MGSEARYMERGGGKTVDERMNSDVATVTQVLTEKMGWSVPSG